MVTLSLVAVGCRCSSTEPEPQGVAGAASVAASAPSLNAAPATLYLPDAAAPLEPLAVGPRVVQPGSSRCPPEMVDVQGLFCIDRYEASLLDAATGQRLSPYYHPTRVQAVKTFDYWQTESQKLGPAWARKLPLPVLPAWQRDREPSIVASNQRGQVPSGYLSADLAALACERAGKRLCSEGEWVQACRGEAGHKYPYGAEYQHGACNVFRDSHPAQLLHSDPSVGHLDPRLNTVREDNDPLLMASGDKNQCQSRWGNDAVYDMVGNLDEWVDDPAGKFVGGFYARATREGCDAAVSSHPRSYFDYSLGTRCCR